MKNLKLRLTTLTLAAFACFNYSALSQVGIGTTSPDASSILDITSTTQGVLTPRMTSAQRLLIASPVKGLLVFDIDEDVFYFYNGGSWLPLEGAEKRDNYKLVKSIADLADELTGGKYVLNEGYLYEINGTIIFDNPIDLNGAFIEGRDTGEDVLFNNSGAALFSGAKGGRFKDIVISGNGQQVFDINGTVAENVIGYSVIISGASSIGTLSDLGVVYFEVLQIVNSTTSGLDASSITSLYMDKVFWTDGNSGTFLTLSGTFDNIQIANGRIVSDSGETGLDVSSNPTINNSASISKVSFTGAGTRVNGYVGTYSGYNFNNDWDVDCPGIPLESDSDTTGYYYMTGNTTNTIFVTDDVPVKVAGVTTSNSLFRTSSTDNKLIYEGKSAREFEVVCTGALDHDTTATPNNRIYEFFLSKTSNLGITTIVPAVSSERRFSNNDVGNFSMVGLIYLEPGDAIEIYVSVNNASDINTNFTRLSVVLK